MACAARTARAGGDRAGQCSGPSNHSRISWTSANGRQRAGVAARAGGHRDQPVGALVDRLVAWRVVDDVVQHDAAVGVHRGVDVRRARRAR